MSYANNTIRVSLDDNIEELVPVGWFEARETHGESLDLLDDASFDIEGLAPPFVGVSCQLDLKQALLDQVVEIVVVSHLRAPALVLPLQGLQLLALLSYRVEHVRVEEMANLFVVVLETLEDEQGGDYEEDFGVSLL